MLIIIFKMKYVLKKYKTEEIYSNQLINIQTNNELNILKITNKLIKKEADCLFLF